VLIKVKDLFKSEVEELKEGLRLSQWFLNKGTYVAQAWSSSIVRGFSLKFGQALMAAMQSQSSGVK